MTFPNLHSHLVVGGSFYFQTLKFHKSISIQLFTKIAEFKYLKKPLL